MHVENCMIATNLAQIARDNNGERDIEALGIAVGLLEEYYTANNEAFRPQNLKPLEFRDGAVLKAISKLEEEKNPSDTQKSQLTILKSAIEIEKELLLGGEICAVLPDIHHWQFQRPEGEANLDENYAFVPPEKPMLIGAWKELRYAGLLSNPHLPDNPEFDEDFVLDADRMRSRVKTLSDKLSDNMTGLDEERLLKTVFVNAAQVMGRRIAFGTPEGQVKPEYWEKLAQTAEALTLG